MTSSRWACLANVAAFALIFSACGAQAQSIEAFYRGKQLCMN